LHTLFQNVILRATTTILKYYRRLDDDSFIPHTEEWIPIVNCECGNEMHPHSSLILVEIKL
jgi:hypothetical protein